MNPTTASPPTRAPTRRTITCPVRFTVEQRSDSLRLSGHAAVFDSESEDLGFLETLAPGCFRRALARPGADQFLLFAHDSNAILARRSAGTLEIQEDGHGLAFTADVVPTTLGKDVVTLVRSGHVTGCSFGFTVLKDEWSTRNGERHRRILEVGELPEITLTPTPAYSATSVRNKQLAERIERTVSRMRRPSGTPDPYQPGGQFSYFRDLLTIAVERRRHNEYILSGIGRDVAPGAFTFGGHPVHGGYHEAEQRLAQLGRHLVETRDLTTTATAGGNFVGAPQHVAEAFSAAVRARAVLPTVLPVHPLPERGMSIKTPRVTTGPATEVQATENVAATEVDLVEANVQSPVSTVTGFTDLSQQLLDRAEPGMDQVIAIELGRSIAEDVDRILLVGSGSAPELRGIDNVTGATSTAYTDASPTQAEAWVRICTCAAAVATALGSEPTHVLSHSRRDAWLFGSSWSSAPLTLPYGMANIACNAITTISGASTNEDRIYILRADELPVYLGPVQTRVNVDYAGSGVLTARIVAYQYASALFARRPEAIGIVSGTGLVAPTF